LKDSKIRASKAVRRYFSRLGKKGGSAGKGSPRVIEKIVVVAFAVLESRRLKSFSPGQCQRHFDLVRPALAKIKFGLDSL
jgi:hypothetical protein